jgi:uncharacterized protein
MPDISSLAEAAGGTRRKGLPPVHLWNPPFCGDIDMRIKADGSWHYLGTPIGRPALVRLFASILRKDPERFVLVTPVERVGITVEDAPFVAVELDRREGKSGQELWFRTNVDDWTMAGAEHALGFRPGKDGGLVPYVHVRGGLEARALRAVWYALVDLAEEREIDGVAWIGVLSRGLFFRIAPSAEAGALA